MKKYLLHTILTIALLFSSCTHKELCYHHPHTTKARINVDWSKFTKETPSGMTVMIYPQSGRPVIRHTSNTISHAIVDLEADMYNTIVFNQSESEFLTITFKDMDRFETAEVSLNNTESKWYTSRANDDKLVMQPEWIATDAQTDGVVTPEMVEITGNELLANKQLQSRTTTEFVIASHVPRNIIQTINVKVYIDGIHNLRSARASLDGLAEGYSLAQRKTTDVQATQLLESWSITYNDNDPTKGFITARITSLGLPYSHSEKADENEFILSLLLVDNKTIIDAPFLVGDKLEKVYDENGDVIELNLELRLSDALPDVQPAGSSSSGFDAIVDEWGDEENIDMEL